MPLIDHRHCCAHARASTHDGFTSPGATRHYPPDLEIEPVHIDIDLHVDVKNTSAAGIVTTTVTAARDTSSELVLDAVDFEDLKIADPDGRTLDWSYRGDKIRVRWADPFSRGESRRVAVTYAVRHPRSGLFFSAPTEAEPDRSWYAATDHETERARHWLPCIDLPNVRTTLSFHLRAESRFTILAGGLLKGSEDHGDGTRTAHWELEARCPSYLVCFALGEFTEAKDGEFEGIELAYYAASRHPAERLLRSFGRTREMLAWMTQRLGVPFPFPKYFQFALPAFGGAMENISLVSWDDMFVLDEVMATEWTWLVDQINAHEMAHSYFGDLVVCRDFAHAWLKESWATYMETCWLEDSKGADEQRYDLYANAQAYFGEADDAYKRPIVTRTFNTSWDMYDRHLYPGGACRLHTLRNELGDETFWAGVNLYLTRFAGKVVETEDFRGVMEEVSGRSLVQFFDQWLYTAGYPHLAVAWEWDSKANEGTFTIEQKQAGDVRAFVFDLELGWVVDGTLQTRKVRVDKAVVHAVVTASQEPSQVRVDPHGRVLHKLEFNPGDGLLRTQLTAASDVVGRIQAGHELAKTGKRVNIDAIAEAWPDEPFWGVRVQFAHALAAAGTRRAEGHLAHLLQTEHDAMVLDPALRAAATITASDAIETAVAALVERGGLGYRARQAAYEILGRAGAQHIETLVAGAREADLHGFAQGGALKGLGLTGDDSVLEHLDAGCVPGGARTIARTLGMSALAALAKRSPKHVRNAVVRRLVAHLRDPVDRVRRAAAMALRDLRAAEATGPLRQYRATLPAQEQVEVDRWIASIAGGQEPKVAALRKDLEKSGATVRKLEERIAALEARLESTSEA